MISDLVYRHKKSGFDYHYVGMAFIEATGTPVIIYKNPTTGTMWVRPVTEFFDKFELLPWPAAQVERGTT
jgi:hypothetical protein